MKEYYNEINSRIDAIEEKLEQMERASCLEIQIMDGDRLKWRRKMVPAAIILKAILQKLGLHPGYVGEHVKFL